MAEPTFIPKPGQVDYTNIRYAPVVNIIVKYANTFLLVKRSKDMRLYPNVWNCISGFLDDAKSVEEKVYEELHEELHVSKANVESLQVGHVLLQEAPEYHKTWLVVPVLATMKTTDFKLNWEAQTAKWFTPQTMKGLKVLSDFSDVIGQFFTFTD